jgi:extradiol dioxygenase family protein
MPQISPFHLAIPVKELLQTREFYRDILGFKEGRTSDHWVDLDFFGHQLVLHLSASGSQNHSNPVDGKNVPVPHFGVVLEWQQWHDFRDLCLTKEIEFVIEPYIRFAGQTGEQATMFFLDPSGNALEFKAFKDPNELFAS